MPTKKCDKCDSEMTRKVIKYFDSHNNVVEYTCKKCGTTNTQIEHIED